MDEINKILGQVAPAIRSGNCHRSKLEAIWRALGYSRTGLQARVAGDLAERWLCRDTPPRLPTDDPRKAAKRLERCLNGETALPLDLAIELINVLPGDYQAAARVLVFPSPASEGDRHSGGLSEALRANAKADQGTDRIRFDLAMSGHELLSADQMRAKAMAFQQEAITCTNLAEELLSLSESRKSTLRAV